MNSVKIKYLACHCGSEKDVSSQFFQGCTVHDFHGELREAIKEAYPGAFEAYQDWPVIAASANFDECDEVSGFVTLGNPLVYGVERAKQ